MISEKIKRIIFNHLYKELSKVEIIPYKDSIYLIDRENKFWYIEYDNNRKLWWRYYYFTGLLKIFCLSEKECNEILSDWVEEILNCKVSIESSYTFSLDVKVSEILNYKVITSIPLQRSLQKTVEEILNCKVITSHGVNHAAETMMEEILNCKVSTSFPRPMLNP